MRRRGADAVLTETSLSNGTATQVVLYDLQARTPSYETLEAQNTDIFNPATAQADS